MKATLLDYQDGTKASETETTSPAIAPPTESHDFTYRLAHLAPLAKLDIVVHSASKAFTYTSGDSQFQWMFQ